MVQANGLPGGELSTAAQRRIVRHLMTGHPLPWRLELDWAVEVTDANSAIVIQCMDVNEANEIIHLAGFLTELDRLLPDLS